VDTQAGATDRAKLIAALSAATTFNGIVELPSRRMDITPGISLSGYSCGIVGRGHGFSAGLTTGRATGCVLYSTAQTGPVLDFVGFAWPDSMRGRVEFGNFAIEGDGISDPTLAHSGMRVGSQTSTPSGVYMHDIAVSRTGGPCMDLGRAYLCDFERLTFNTPVDAQVNNVPYFVATAPNANRFSRLGFRSTITTNDCGVGGALVLKDDGSVNAPGSNVFSECWTEFLHIPTNGTVFSFQGSGNQVLYPEFADTGPLSGATNTSVVAFNPLSAGITDNGGNVYQGYMPGGSASAGYPTTGIVVAQSRNVITGTKGFPGANVTINSGVTNTTVIARGAVGAASGSLVVDNSGNQTNYFRDDYLGTSTVGAYKTSILTAGLGGAGPRFMDQADTTKGAVWVGDQGVRLQAVSKAAFVTADSIQFRTTTLANTIVVQFGSGPKVLNGNGSPEGVQTAPVGSIYLRSDGGAATTLYVKESGTGNTGWIGK
jgi:hypothetical protein